jgi:hypothetical protein
VFELPIHSILNDVLVGTDPRDIVDRAIVVHWARTDKETFQNLLQSIRRELRPAVRELQSADWRATFEWFYDQKAVPFLEWFADRVGLLDACRTRGMQGLFKIRAMKMAVGASLSFVYAAGFEGRREERGDSRDVLHATLAAAIDAVFVTHDTPLRECLLARVPLKGFRILTLPQLLEEVGRH